MDKINNEMKKYCELVALYLHLKYECSLWNGLQCFLRNEELESTTQDARSKLENELLETAVDYLNKAEALSGNESDIIYFLKAKIASEQQLEEMAMVYLSKAIELKPDNGIYYEERGLKYYHFEKKYNAAIFDFKKAMQLKGTHWIPYRYLSLSYQRLCQWDEFFKSIATALKYNNYSYGEYEYYFGVIKKEYESDLEESTFSKSEEIVQALEKLIKKQPIDFYFLVRAYVYECVDLFKDAFDDYTRAIECNINPIFCRYARKHLDSRYGAI